MNVMFDEYLESLESRLASLEREIADIVKLEERLSNLESKTEAIERALQYYQNRISSSIAEFKNES